MKVTVTQSVKAPASAVWSIITDIERSLNVITAIEKIEVLEKPDSGVEGLKWKETRTMFGKEATETMWITDVEEGRSYNTRAESHGSVYVTRMAVESRGEGSEVSMSFEGTPQTMGAKIMWFFTGWMAKSSMKKALQKDLLDIAAAAEQG